MKILEKITLIIYSYVMLILAVILSLLVFNWLDIDLVGGIISNIITGETSSKILLGVNIVFILLSIKCIFLMQHQKNKLKKDKEFF